MLLGPTTRCESIIALPSWLTVLAPRLLRKVCVARLAAGVSLIAASLSSLTGCSSGMTSTAQTGPVPGGSTAVTLLVSSTANDQLTEFRLTIVSLTLTNQAGSAVTVFTNSSAASDPHQYTEFIHLNGNSEPFAGVSIPQDMYTAATLTCGQAEFTFLSNSQGSVSVNTNSDFCGTGGASVAINLPSPITISGAAMGLALDLQASQSASFSPNPPPAVFSITPVFTLTPVAISAQPTDDRNGKETGFTGRVASVDSAANSFTITIPDRSTLILHSGTETVMQGIAGFSALTPGMFVNLDAEIQADGSLLATRIEVNDASARNVLTGPLLQTSLPLAASGAINPEGRQQQGDDLSVNPTTLEEYQFDSSTVFSTSGQFSNLKNLPFPASFEATSLALGQNISVFSPALTLVANPLTKATTVTLEPQTLNGAVTAASTGGGFQVYTLSLAPYDPISLISGASTVMVYVDTNAHVLTSAPITPGSTVRFTGLLFNDQGTLRMDANQANDGVTE